MDEVEPGMEDVLSFGTCSFSTPLGKADKSLSKSLARFFYENEDIVEILTDTAVQVYVATEGSGRTFRRSQDRQGEITNGGVPATFTYTSDTILKVTHTGRNWEPSPPAPISFLEFLYEWGGYVDVEILTREY